MSFSRQEIEERLRLGEASRWEFKRVEFRGRKLAGPSRDDLADEIAAFANADGGVLLCGVTDAGEAQGLSRDRMDALERVVTEVCNDSIKPPINPEILRLEVADGRPLVLVSAPAGYALHESPGGRLHRLGSSKRKMTSDQALRLAQRRGQARFLGFDKQPVPGTGFNTLEESLWKPLLSAEGAAEPEGALERMGLLVGDENEVLRASVAGILLCCESPDEWLPNACITATCYRGRDRASGQFDAQTITGPLHRQIADAVAFAVRNMRVSAHKSPAREEVPQYSERALFEAVVNAVVHRDYTVRGSRIRLSMFDDRLEIQSPGALPNGMTVDSLGYRQSTRNEVLAAVFGRVPVGGIRGSDDRRYLMERRGDGVPIIQRETRELGGRPAKFEMIDEADLRLILPAASLEPSGARAAITVRCGERAVGGVDLLALFPNKTGKQATTNEDGEAEVELHSTHLPMTVFAAAPGYEARMEREWTPAEQGALVLAMRELPDGGSIIFPEGGGCIPGLAGRLNPIRDPFDRTYLHISSKLAVNEGQQPPVRFTPGEDLRLTDADGRDFTVRIVDVVGQAALVEYRRDV